ncbi:MAG TPA: DUF1361 domain-containing protein, partial [Candidatus Limosilactobacillus merdipullorum]|nr:DUF1361 domain-containing protein [Candidatus Limosilactobacillus merdipullorum]
MKEISTQWQIRFFLIAWIIILKFVMKAPYNFMSFNVFLAYVPIELGFQLRRFADRRSLAFWGLLILWIVFYPNAPYVITDLFHLAWLHPHTSISGILRSDPHMWFIFSLMIISAFACALFGAISLLQTSRLLTMMTTPYHLQWRLVWITLCSFISSVGIYIGRFLRLHSLYILMTPSWFIKQLLA